MSVNDVLQHAQYENMNWSASSIQFTASRVKDYIMFKLPPRAFFEFMKGITDHVDKYQVHPDYVSWPWYDTRYKFQAGGNETRYAEILKRNEELLKVWRERGMLTNLANYTGLVEGVNYVGDKIVQLTNATSLGPLVQNPNNSSELLPPAEAAVAIYNAIPDPVDVFLQRIFPGIATTGLKGLALASAIFAYIMDKILTHRWLQDSAAAAGLNIMIQFGNNVIQTISTYCGPLAYGIGLIAGVAGLCYSVASIFQSALWMYRNGLLGWNMFSNLKARLQEAMLRFYHDNPDVERGPDPFGDPGVFGSIGFRGGGRKDILSERAAEYVVGVIGYKKAQIAEYKKTFNRIPYILNGKIVTESDIFNIQYVNSFQSPLKQMYEEAVRSITLFIPIQQRIHAAGALQINVGQISASEMFLNKETGSVTSWTSQYLPTYEDSDDGKSQIYTGHAWSEVAKNLSRLWTTYSRSTGEIAYDVPHGIPQPRDTNENIVKMAEANHDEFVKRYINNEAPPTDDIDPNVTKTINVLKIIMLLSEYTLNSDASMDYTIDELWNETISNTHETLSLRRNLVQTIAHMRVLSDTAELQIIENSKLLKKERAHVEMVDSSFRLFRQKSLALQGTYSDDSREIVNYQLENTALPYYTKDPKYVLENDYRQTTNSQVVDIQSTEFIIRELIKENKNLLISRSKIDQIKLGHVRDLTHIDAQNDVLRIKMERFNTNMKKDLQNFVAISPDESSFITNVMKMMERGIKGELNYMRKYNQTFKSVEELSMKNNANKANTYDEWYNGRYDVVHPYKSLRDKADPQNYTAKVIEKIRGIEQKIRDHEKMRSEAENRLNNHVLEEQEIVQMEYQNATSYDQRILASFTQAQKGLELLMDDKDISGSKYADIWKSYGTINECYDEMQDNFKKTFSTQMKLSDEVVRTMNDITSHSNAIESLLNQLDRAKEFLHRMQNDIAGSYSERLNEYMKANAQALILSQANETMLRAIIKDIDLWRNGEQNSDLFDNHYADVLKERAMNESNFKPKIPFHADKNYPVSKAPTLFDSKSYFVHKDVNNYAINPYFK